MINRTPVVFVILLTCLFQDFVSSQVAQQKTFLKSVGAIDSLYSEILDEYREIYVQLPEGYNADENEKFPIAIILDGEILLPTVHNVQSFYSGGFTPEMVLVGISNAKSRTRDLTTSQITEKYGRPYSERNGEAEKFISFIQSELIPYIEKKYPVTNFRTLIGHSYGGLFTIYTLLHHPQLFNNYIAIDPSLDWDDQQILSDAPDKLRNYDYRGKSLFMSLSGQLHMQNPDVTLADVMEDKSDFTIFARSNIAFSEMLQQDTSIDLAFKWQFYPDDLHGTVSFPSIMEGLIFDFKWYQMEHTAKFNSPETSQEILSDIIEYRAAKLKRYFSYPVPPYPEELLNVLGYMSLDMDQERKSRMFFEYAIEYYPMSPNVYDSMADFYERKSDYVKALEYVSKAYELSGDDYYKNRMETLKQK